MQPAAKMARPSAVAVRLPYMSNRALSAVLDLAKKEKLPEAASARSQRRVRDADCKQQTPYGPLHQAVWLEDHNGEQVRMEIQHPWAMLYYAVSMSEGLSKLLQQMERTTSITNPVQLVFYGDEVHPGNPLANTHGRKIWAFYWTLLHFGGAAMSDEDACMNSANHMHLQQLCCSTDVE